MNFTVSHGHKSPKQFHQDGLLPSAMVPTDRHPLHHRLSLCVIGHRCFKESELCLHLYHSVIMYHYYHHHHPPHHHHLSLCVLAPQPGSHLHQKRLLIISTQLTSRTALQHGVPVIGVSDHYPICRTWSKKKEKKKA